MIPNTKAILTKFDNDQQNNEMRRMLQGLGVLHIYPTDSFDDFERYSAVHRDRLALMIYHLSRVPGQADVYTSGRYTFNQKVGFFLPRCDIPLIVAANDLNPDLEEAIKRELKPRSVLGWPTNLETLRARITQALH